MAAGGGGFGRASGPPATRKQIEYLTSLVGDHELGTLREARYRLGLTQRQAGGKFTIGEASELIDRLTDPEFDPDAGADAAVGTGTGSGTGAVSETASERSAARAEERLQRE